MSEALLPEDFAALEPFVAQWAVAGSAARSMARTYSTDAERQAFYAAGAPLLAEALTYLDATLLANHDATQQRLMNLCLALAHVAMAVEAHGPDEARHAPMREAMIITRTPADA
jgi:hypothetical protein